MVPPSRPTGFTISPASSIHDDRAGDRPASLREVEASPADPIDKETRIPEERGHHASPVDGPWDAYENIADTPLTPQERWHTKASNDIPFLPPKQTDGSRFQQELEEARTRSAMSGTLPTVTSYGPAPIPEEDNISPAPTAPWQSHPRVPQPLNVNGPYMHYEDVAYLGPEHQSSDGKATAPPERRETFPGIPTGLNRPEARKSWDRQRRKQAKTQSPTSDKIQVREGDGVRPRTSVGKHITSWTAEILWSATSLACLGAIVGVLKVYDGRGLADWPLAISLNALVAFLEALCRVALVVPLMEGMAQLRWNWFARGERPLSDFSVIDDATRGPVGSARLLAKRKGRLLGMSGAFGLLTCFASSPLTQLAIEFPTRLVVRGGTTDIARSLSYSRGSLSGELDSREKQGIQRGIYHRIDEEILPLQPTCSTADCQWPSFDTLAICAATADISGKLVTSSQTEIFVPGTGPSSNGDEEISVYNASLPNGVFLTGSPGTYNLNISSPPSSILRQGDYLPVTTSLGFPGVDDRVSSAIANLFVIYTNQTTESPQSNRCFRAVEAILYFCVNRYSAAANKGIVTTTLLRSSPLANLSSPFSVQANKRQVPTATVTTALALPEPTTGAGVIRTEHEGTEYTVSRNDAGLLHAYLGSVLSGTYSRRYGTAASTPGAAEVLGAAMFHDGSASGTVSEGEMRDIVANMTRNVAASLTNAIRTTNTLPSSSSPSGTEFLPETYIRVRFAWLAFVAAQVALSVAFLAGIMVQTAVWDVEVVKGAGSAAAVLTAVSADDRARVVVAGGVREMPARLIREGGGRPRLALEPGGGS